jgi:hypothetical protein
MPEDTEVRDNARRKRLHARHRNERVKMIAGTVDRLGTVVLGGAVLVPIFQLQPVSWRRICFWILAAVLLHLIALYVLGLQKEEE